MHPSGTIVPLEQGAIVQGIEMKTLIFAIFIFSLHAITGGLSEAMAEVAAFLFVLFAGMDLWRMLE